MSISPDTEVTEVTLLGFVFGYVSCPEERRVYALLSEGDFIFPLSKEALEIMRVGIPFPIKGEGTSETILIPEQMLGRISSRWPGEDALIVQHPSPCHTQRNVSPVWNPIPRGYPSCGGYAATGSLYNFSTGKMCEN